MQLLPQRSSLSRGLGSHLCQAPASGGRAAALLSGLLRRQEAIPECESLACRRGLLPWGLQGPDPPCVWGALTGHQTGCLTCVPCMRACRPGPASTAVHSQGSPSGRPSAPLSHAAYLRPLHVPAGCRHWVAWRTAAGVLPSEDRGLWEASVGAGAGRERGSHARACRGALWPEVSFSREVRGQRGSPAHTFTPKARWGGHLRAVCEYWDPCGTVACFSVVTLGAAWMER